MTEFLQAGSERDGFLGVDMEGSNFSFSGTAHNILDDLGDDQDGGVEERVVATAEEKGSHQLCCGPGG